MASWVNLMETLDKYSVELQEVTKYLWKLICENLGLNSEKLASMFEDGTQGLQIKNNGRWVPIKPVPVVNIGDIIEILSNGEHKGIEHRAVVNTERERLSIAGFLSRPGPGSRCYIDVLIIGHVATRETLDKYSVVLQQVTKYLWKLICENLGLNSEKLASLFEDGTQGLRMNYYPPCPQASRVMGLTPHSDAVGLTLLIQVNDVQGLQIKNNGRWVPIKPVPGALIVNIGDIIEILSNGEYKSIEHRAVVNTERERLSIAGFHSPNMMTMIGPMPDLVKKAANYKAISNEEYIRLVVTSKLNGKNLLDHMKLKQ
ncbi:protein SRG1-like [Prunus avium]|uniref:Protein SRG1-like n=1 Tax=Prunus avium TaxID=42229 RepID=A0A6P5S7M8_PRUAV|nr:protein SRG1-like [Prunus avium]